MPAAMPKDTAAALGPDAGKCDSRSLFLDRFANPAAKDSGTETPRREWFNRLLQKQPVSIRTADWAYGLPGALPFTAQLQSRLMVNMAGGVMENAGLCLDRFGLPYIPGSAVKGCARRFALAALHEWCDAGGQLPDKPAGADNPCTRACAPFDTPAEMLAAIARVFGWCEQDWSDKRKDDRFLSDFAWACSGMADSPAPTGHDVTAQGNVPGSQRQTDPGPERATQTWSAIRNTVVHQLARKLRLSIPGNQPVPSTHLPNFAGSVSFLPAHPVDFGNPGKVEGLPLEVPALGKLELDVVTCHHRDYYDGKLDTATDTEDPVPVVFPAVVPGHVFTFALARLRTVTDADLSLARAWLQSGLETFGIGARTNAGYGWFECGDGVQKAVQRSIEDAKRRRVTEAKRQDEAERRKADEEARLRRIAEEKAATAGMTPAQKADYALAQLNDEQFRGRLDQFEKRDPAEQEAIVRALRLPPEYPPSRRRFWDEFKRKAAKGGRAARTEAAIRELSRKLHPGKEGKMP